MARSSGQAPWRLLAVWPSCPFCNLGDPPECQHTAAVRLRELRDIGLRQRDRGAIRLVCRDLGVGWIRHRSRSFARKGCLDRWPQLRKLPRLTLGVVLSELRHDFRGKEFESFADVFVPVLPALLDKYRLVHAGILESAQRLAQFRGRADASGAPTEHLSAELINIGDFRRETGDGEHAEIMISERIYRVRLADLA